MKKRVISFVLTGLALALVTLTSCERRKIYEEGGTWVVVDVDWSALSQAPNGTTVAFFPEDDALKPEYLLTNYTQDKIKLKAGRWNVICFNETIDGHSYVKFRGTDKFETFEAYLKPVTLTNGTITIEAGASPEPLAAETYENFVVTPENVVNEETLYLSFAPQSVLSTLTVKADITGIDNARDGGSHSAIISGFIDGYMMGTGEVTENENTQMFYLNQTVHDETDYSNGYITGTVNCFGIASQTPGSTSKNSAMLNFQLRDGSFLDPVEFDATDDIYVDPNDSRKFYLDVDGITLPFTEDEDGSGAGFDADVDEWGEEVIIPVPI